ncbi:MAG: PhzF family phenazine biosynthesis protein [Woeseiaceae bacterium]
MASIRLLHIDAFTDQAFSGNPAAVCLLDDARETAWMQSVAAEMNLSETAFVRPQEDGFALRWFTPKAEVDLCGHATLAAAHALWTTASADADQSIRFHTRSGLLECSRQGTMVTMDFPATPVEKPEDPKKLTSALGIEPSFAGASKFDLLAVVQSEDVLRALKPDMAALRAMPVRGVIVTCRADDAAFDFVSRFFAPGVGVDEDPVTGSAHCCLGPFWSRRLGRDELLAFQASPRGGVVAVQVAGDRVILGGQAVTVLDGHLDTGG